MIRCTLLLLLLLPSLSVMGVGALGTLYEEVQAQRILERKNNDARLKRFTAARDQQQQLLAEARALLIEEQATAARLEKTFETNNGIIRNREKTLEGELGDAGQLRDHIIQSAVSLHETIENSLVSAQIPNREQALAETIRNNELPPLDEIEALWHLQLQEMVEMGRVVRFQADIIDRTGKRLEKQVIRTGLFGSVADGRYLRYLPGSGQLLETTRQPPTRYRDMALKLQQSASGIVPMPIDPTRGDLLAELSRTPGLEERMKQGLDQGGVIGWIITGLGIIGLTIAIGRLSVLLVLDRRIRRQLEATTPNRPNPLGRILKVYRDNPEIDTETLGLKLDEAILRELPRIRWGIGTLSVLAAIAPLLGLLGTVTGIIETFQAVTIHGTGDPRLMSGGISRALVTTVQGLVVAIPLLLLHSFLSSRSNRIIQILDEQSAAMVAKLAERQPSSTQPEQAVSHA
ncbi:MAG: MotA/TolQ/ExbB proton channel family protein [Gammaproteobacteria bacterium]|nr:MotA/TolQ/ExbB proton channel family protein [Gammaproteobacteria bacterium]